MSTNELQDRAARFVAMHSEPGIVMLPNAWDPGSAILFEEAGFSAIATTSSGIAFSSGLPDGQKMSRERMLDICAGIAQAVKVPVSADLEAGYGRLADDVATTVRGALAAGLAGCNIEDGTHDKARPLFEIELSVERILAGADVVRAAGKPFVLNARTDAFLARPGHADNFTETVRRANAYREAGAACLFVLGVVDAETVGRLVREIDGPINLMLGRAGGSGGLTVAQYEALGVKRISVGGSIAQAALAVVRRAAKEIRSTGTFGYAKDALTHPELMKLMSKR